MNGIQVLSLQRTWGQWAIGMETEWEWKGQWKWQWKWWPGIPGGVGMEMGSG